MFRSFVLSLFVVVAGTSLPAYERGGDDGGATAGLSSRATKAVVSILTRDFERCQRFDRVYRYDCYRLTYKRGVDRIAGAPAYLPARKALESVEETLEGIVDRNVDPSRPVKRQGLQTYRPITTRSEPKARRQLDAALSQAETVLLRSAGDENAHFTRIAQAINSNKVLLRSALLWLRGVLGLRLA